MEKKESVVKFARSFRDLEVYKMARELQRGVFEVSKGFPREERFSLTDQVRRSSRSIGAQIAEAWAKRRYEKHFVSKLSDGLGEAQETEHWLETAQDDGYLDAGQTRELLSLATRIGGMLNSIMDKSESFCAPFQSRVKEDDEDIYLSS